MKLKDEELYKKIVSHFNESLSAQSEMRTEMREYDDFYLAKHWNKERATWRPDPIVNYVSYIVDQKAPQLTNNRPSGLILPTSQDDEEAAKLFTQVTDVISERVDLDDKNDQVVRAGLLLSTGWYKVYWDNSLTGGSPVKGNIWKGDVAIDIPDPSNIFTDPNAVTVDECRYIIYCVPKSIQWVEQKFDVKVDPDTALETEIFDRPSTNHGKDRVLFYEYWHKDKEGIHCTYAAGGQILKEIKKVYKHGRYPFVPFVAKKNRKSIWGISEIKNILSNQKLLNKLVELPVTHAMLHANPITLVDPKSGIDISKWQNKPGQLWYAKDPKNSVGQVKPPEMPSDVYKLADNLIQYIEKMGGVYDSMTGSTPTGITAATAIQLLQEQGSIPIKGIIRNLHQSLKDVYELMIELVKENYTETRFIRLIDEDGTVEFKEFNAIQYAEIDFDVKVSAGDSTPTSKAYVSQLGADLFQQGLLLGSEYVEMQEGLPNKDRIVARLREQEEIMKQQSMMQEQQMINQPPMSEPFPMNADPSMQQPMDIPIQDSSNIKQQFDDIYENSPEEIQQQLDVMLEQGMTEEQIVAQLMGI
ncbi:hypothetical protein [Bacillus sp. J37]|uniref:portal protein n=1 Tax=Bacillus sp. J37 TaxID=935837 RepID=UPI00047E230F|nr:hypothetical protein [Bacillus sp. J37]